MTDERQVPPSSVGSPGNTRFDRRSDSRREPFDLLNASLEPGISLVEASAGTGKTFCITQMVLRLLLERDASGEYRAKDIGRILVVTFTNKATDELITRIRCRLREAVEVFSGVTERSNENQVLFDLRDKYGPDGLQRLRDALAKLDQLAVFTIHGFCKRVLDESALESGTPFDATFLDEDATLADRAAQDWWRRTMYESRELASMAVKQEWTHDQFLRAWRAWRRHPETRIAPEVKIEDAVAELRQVASAFADAWASHDGVRWAESLKWNKDAPLGSADARDAFSARVAAIHAGRFGALPDASDWLAPSTVHAKGKLAKAGSEAVLRHEIIVAAKVVGEALVRLSCALRCSFIERVEGDFEREKSRRQLLGYDDLLRRLRDALGREGPQGNLARAIRARYDAALIDEFQDTDQFQFPIFSTAFAGRPLFLIGDPKQAIYGFRGADLFAYIRAVEHAKPKYTLTSNWRSTPNMLRAVEKLFTRRAKPFLFDSIDFAPVTAARELQESITSDGKGALVWWYLPPEGTGKEAKALPKGKANELLLQAMSAEVARLVAAGTHASEIAVLVRDRYMAAEVQQNLWKAGVRSIIGGVGDVLDSPEMRDLEVILGAVVAPNDARFVRAALATEAWGKTAAEIHALAQPSHEGAWAGIIEQLERTRTSWLRHGFFRAAMDLIGAVGAFERLLRYEDGERRITNLRHAIELLHDTSAGERLSPEGLLGWLARARVAGTEDSSRKELRLESDADAVRILTIHKSKGLEFDVVFCPALWEAKCPERGAPVLVHDEHGGVVLDQGSTSYDDAWIKADGERLAEDLRLTYVALTRARFRCYLGWGAAANAKSGIGAANSAIGYLLSGVEAQASPGMTAQLAAKEMRNSMPQWEERIHALAASSEGAISVQVVRAGGPAVPAQARAAKVAPVLSCRTIDGPARQFESWRINSFTSLTAGSHGGDVSSATEDARDVWDRGPADDRKGDRSNFLAFPAGRGPGVALHALFEHASFDAGDEELRTLCSHTLVQDQLATGAEDARIDAALSMMQRVLRGPMSDAGFSLRDVPGSRTLREFGFHLPLGRITPGVLCDRFLAHGGDVARRYAPALRSLRPDETHGFLTGFMDLAFEHEGRWHIVDWKSNHLGWDRVAYEESALVDEMVESHYVLQYHLYTVALHRYLRLRVPGYDYDTHMGGSWYAFLRGVDGEGRGWFSDRPSRELVESLDALLDDVEVAS